MVQVGFAHGCQEGRRLEHLSRLGMAPGRQARAQAPQPRTVLRTALEFPNSPISNFLIVEFQSQLPPALHKRGCGLCSHSH